MDRTAPALLVLLGSLLFVTPGRAAAHAPDSAAPTFACAAVQDPGGEQDPTAPPEIPRPGTLEEAVAVDVRELRGMLEGQSEAALSAALEVWLGLLDRAETQLEEARAETDRNAAAQTLDQVATVAGEIARVLKAEGGEADAALQQIEDIQEQRRSAAQQQSIAGLSMAEAMSIDPKVLDARLRPLPAEKVKEALDAWQQLLERKALEFSGAEVASRQAAADGDAATQERLEGRMRGLRLELDRLRQRYDRIVRQYERKGADAEVVADYRAYGDSVVPPVAISGLHSAWEQLRDWATSMEGGLGNAVSFATGLLVFVVILLVFRWLARLAGGIVDRSLGAVKARSRLLRSFLVNTTRKVVFFIGVVVGLGQIGVDIGPLLAAIGAAGLVLGFALQGTLSNFASGVMLMIYRPYDVGDVVETGGVFGLVDDMNLVSTTVKTFDNQAIVVPNSKIWGDVITNVTANETRRCDLTFSIAYTDDIQLAIDTMREVVEAHPKTLAEPAPNIKLHELGDSSLNFICRPWVKTVDYWEVYWDLVPQVKEAFDRKGLTIPFPQRDVHLYRSEPPE